MPKNGEIKETNNARYVWRGEPENGYWSVIEDEDLVKDRVPLVCPACGNMLEPWDVDKFHRWGVDAECYINFLEGRENLPQFKNNRERAVYCKQKFEEKSKLK